MLNEILKTEIKYRDAKWQQNFLHQFVLAQLEILAPDSKTGPDGWPYLLVGSFPTEKDTSVVKRSSVDAIANLSGTETSRDIAIDSESGEPVTKVIHWLSERGIGMVLNPDKETPDYLFPYGVLWNFRETGSFYSPLPERESGRFQIAPGQKVMTGDVTEKILPGYARKIVRQFFADQGVFAPKAMMLSLDGREYDICFSLESLKSPPAHEHANLAEAISWFLPAHYVVTLLSEKMLDGFKPL
jgi:hypothetical protein